MATDPSVTTLAPEQPEPSLRDAIDAAFDEHATDEVDEHATPAEHDRPRDAGGRFAKAGPGEAPESPVEARAQPEVAQGTAAVPAAPAAPDLKAPASWTPAAREKWASVDPTIKAEVSRREWEAQRVLQESAGMREFVRTFNDVVRPYEMFIRMENSDPMRAVQTLMQTAAEMKMGTPQSKVNIVADIIKGHAVDLKMLDDTLATMFNPNGQGQVQQPQQPLRDPRVDQILYQQHQERQQRAQWEDNAMRQGLTQFAAAHEFYDDVRDTMADLVDATTRRGAPVDLEAIYQRACQLDPEVSKILEQRTPAASRPGGPSQAVLRARRAAVSVKGDPTPTGATVPKDDSVRSAIEAAIDSTNV